MSELAAKGAGVFMLGERRDENPRSRPSRLEREISNLNGKYRRARQDSNPAAVRLVIEQDGDLKHEAK